MYYYVYDEFVQDQKFERDLALIETRLTDLGISGKIARLALFRDATELIQDEVKKGASTVVAVGNDMTLRKVIDAVGDSGVAIAIVPLGSNDNKIASLLGVPRGVEACDVLSARIIEELDVGVVNGRRFLNELHSTNVVGVKINCDGQYDLSPMRKSVLEVRNLADADDEVPAAKPTDGKLEIVLRTPSKSWIKSKTGVTLVPVGHATISCDAPIQISIDGELFEGEEFHIEVIPNRLKVVTGRERKF
ncbi:MAG: diacylglycerol kinase family protein [Patescibacteria group bacterium]|nr:hypothetical protein [Patescibacteria group bacterium]